MRNDPAPDEKGPDKLPESPVSASEGSDEAAGGGGAVRNLEVRELRSDSGPVQRGRHRKGKGDQPGAADRPEDSGGAPAGVETEDFHLKFDWETIPLQHGEIVLQQLREELTRGAKILQARLDANADAVVLCSNEDCKRPIRNGAWVSRHIYRNQETGLQITVTSCSERCHIINHRNIKRPVQEHRQGGMVRG